MQRLPSTSPHAQRYASTLALLALFLVADVLCILVHMVHVWSPWLNARHYSIEFDGGMAEQYQYIKWFWLCVCLAFVFWQARAVVYLGWMALFALLLLDDVVQLHERVGAYLATQWHFPSVMGLRAVDFGEMVVAAGIGGIAATVVVLTFWRGGAQPRLVSVDLLLLLGALAFFGVFVDAAHTVAYFHAPALAPVLTLIEDGGEMLVVSVTTAYVFDIAGNAGKLRFELWRHLRGYLKRTTDIALTPGRLDSP